MNEAAELSQAAWRDTSKVNFKIDVANYDDVATELKITRQEAMLLNQLTILTNIYGALCYINNFVADLHQERFPEKWAPRE